MAAGRMPGAGRPLLAPGNALTGAWLWRCDASSRPWLAPLRVEHDGVFTGRAGFLTAVLCGAGELGGAGDGIGTRAWNFNSPLDTYKRPEHMPPMFTQSKHVRQPSSLGTNPGARRYAFGEALSG
jgi:hypothetical protein